MLFAGSTKSYEVLNNTEQESVTASVFLVNLVLEEIVNVGAIPSALCKGGDLFTVKFSGRCINNMWGDEPEGGLLHYSQQQDAPPLLDF